MLPMRNTSCNLNGEQHCITCSDEALPFTILSINAERGMALVAVNDNNDTEEVDITLVEDIAPGDTLLVHGGVAIGRL